MIILFVCHCDDCFVSGFFISFLYRAYIQGSFLDLIFSTNRIALFFYKYHHIQAHYIEFFLYRIRYTTLKKTMTINCASVCRRTGYSSFKLVLGMLGVYTAPEQAGHRFTYFSVSLTGVYMFYVL